MSSTVNVDKVEQGAGKCAGGAHMAQILSTASSLWFLTSLNPGSLSDAAMVIITSSSDIGVLA